MPRLFGGRPARLVAGALLLGMLSITVPGCSGGSGGAVATLVNQAAAAFAGYFAGLTVLTNGASPFAASGDLNGDGLPDLVAAVLTSLFGSNDGGVSVQIAQGPGQFGEPVFLSAGENAQVYTPVLGDFDEDGFPDIAAADSGNDAVVVWLNNGDGTFGAAASFPAGSSSSGLASGDFNGDGHLDLVTSNFGDDTVSVFLGNGDGSFGAQTAFATGLSGTAFVATADLTGDGNLDLAVSDQNDPVVAILEGNGDGNFDGAEPTKVSIPGSGGPGGGASLFEITARLAQADPRERLNLLTNVDMPGGNASFVLQDFNGDSAVDIAVSLLEVVTPEGIEQGPGGVGVALNQGGGTFGAGTLFPTTGAFNVGLTSGDYDGDGITDLAATSAGANNVSILRGDGMGAFEEVGIHDVGLAPFGILTADIDLDGRGDLVACNLYLNNMTLLRGLGAGDFISTPGFDLGIETELPPLAAGDLNGDGLDDLVVGASEADALAIFLNQGDGTFGDPTFAEPGAGIFSLALGDLDEDGFPDLVAAGLGSMTSGLGGGAVVVMLNDQEGGFGAPTSFTLEGPDPAELALADFTQDGHLDVVVAVPDENAMALYPGNGDGTLGDFDATEIGVSGTALTVGDFDGDGVPDVACGGVGTLILGNGPTDQVSVLLNDGLGNFGTPTFLASEAIVETLTNGDFNGDGFPDVMILGVLQTDGLEGQATLFLNDGLGGFQEAGTLTAGIIPTDLLAADVNGDGNLDAVVLDLYLSSAVVFYGDGQGDFPTATGYNAGGAPVFAAFGNFNGDGFPDLAASNLPVSLVGGASVARVHVLNSFFR